MATGSNTGTLNNFAISFALGQPLHDLSDALVNTTQVSQLICFGVRLFFVMERGIEIILVPGYVVYMRNDQYQAQKLEIHEKHFKITN